MCSGPQVTIGFEFKCAAAV